MFQHNERKATISDALGHGELHYKIYSYIATFGVSKMVNQRIKIASEWLDHPSSILYAQTFYEANKSIHRQQYDFIITDNDSYYKLIEHLPAFKIKIEKDFFSDKRDPLLSSKPLYYKPETNTLFIREHSAHNSRFLYEILKIALTPPVIILKINEGENTAHALSFKQLRNAIHTVFPYIKLYDKKQDSTYHEQIILNYSPLLYCKTEKNRENTLKENKENYLDIPSLFLSTGKPRDNIDEHSTFNPDITPNLISYFWKINKLLKKQGYLGLYNDSQEILRCYQQAQHACSTYLSK
jgi:hypothetical protein